MNCKNCGLNLPEKSKFCVSCGTEQSEGKRIEQVDEKRLRVGYSEKINDPQIAAIIKRINKSGIVFTLVLSVIAIIGFSVAGVLEVGGFELPSAFFIGLAIGGLLIIIALIQKARAKKDITWDGTIIDKKIKQPSLSERKQGHLQTKYSVHIRLENSKTKVIQYTEELFNYYQIGERVRHHAGTASHILEKYDKSNDTVIYCVACTSKNDIDNDTCYRCKCPLLK